MAKASADGKRVDQVLDIIKEMTMLELRDLNDRIQEGLDDISDDCTLGAGGLRDAINELLFRDRGHEQQPTSVGWNPPYSLPRQRAN
ncbi:MAG: hypothetical protein IH920_03075 [Chloroflexi bacterium]|nr:hypothetical protein [Chloroflexota bacterium]